MQRAENGTRSNPMPEMPLYLADLYPYRGDAALPQVRHTHDY